MKIKLLFASLLLAASMAFGQSQFSGGGGSSITYVGTAPSGNCAANVPVQVLITGAGGVYYCGNISGGVGTWTLLGGSSGSGTVNVGTANEVAYYPASAAAVSGDPTLTDTGTSLTYTGSAGITVSGSSTITGTLVAAPAAPASGNALMFPNTATGSWDAEDASGNVYHAPQYTSTGKYVFAVDASDSTLQINGSVFASSSAPMIFVKSATGTFAGSANGTIIGVIQSGFSGNFIDFQTTGAAGSVFSINASGYPNIGLNT
jgi:hypothetical protein